MRSIKTTIRVHTFTKSRATSIILVFEGIDQTAVQCLYTADNVAISKPANQTTGILTGTFDAHLAVDGFTGTTMFSGHCAVVDDVFTKSNAWWYVDLQETFTVYGVTIKQPSEQNLVIQV